MLEMYVEGCRTMRSIRSRPARVKNPVHGDLVWILRRIAPAENHRKGDIASNKMRSWFDVSRNEWTEGEMQQGGLMAVRDCLMVAWTPAAFVTG